MNHRINTPLRAISFAVLLLVSGCSIFSPVGDAIGGAYENTVSYFNAYFNARRLFIEAEDEIFAAERLARGKEQLTPTVPTAPPTAKAKLNQAIDKCSNILAFHTKSSLVDNSLFLIGRSFYYLGDYLKAERKFTELLSQYPTSDLQLETQFWFARCSERLNRLDEALQACDVLIPNAHEADEDRLEIEASLLKASILRRKGSLDQSAAVLRAAIETEPDDDLMIKLRTALGDVEFEAARYEHSSQEFLTASNEAEDPFDGYYARLRAAIALRKAGRSENSTALLQGMADDFRYREWIPAIKFELGNSLLAAGRTEEAIDAYRFVDTMQVRTDSSPKSAMELGRIYERMVFDYAEAQKSYARATTSISRVQNDEARRKSEAFNRYFMAYKKIAVLDSTYQFQKDTLAKWTEDSLARASMDSAKFTPKPVVMREDSVHRLRSTFQQEIADVFYSELQVADSAVYWYDVSMKESMDSVRTPRVLFILAEIARSNPDKGFTDPDRRYDVLLSDYSSSEYARAVKRDRNELADERSDSAAISYRLAEALVDSGKNQAALALYEEIQKRFPASPYAAKSSFAAAWLYENRLHQPDSAVARYRRTTIEHSKTPYAVAASRRFIEAKPTIDTTRVDTLGRSRLVPSDTTDREFPLPSGSKNTQRRRPPAKTAIPDTARTDAKPNEEID